MQNVNKNLPDFYALRRYTINISKSFLAVKGKENQNIELLDIIIDIAQYISLFDSNDKKICCKFYFDIKTNKLAICLHVGYIITPIFLDSQPNSNNIIHQKKPLIRLPDHLFSLSFETHS